MDMQLRYHVTQRRNVHFMGAGHMGEFLCYVAHLVHHFRILRGRQIVEFAQRRPFRHKNNPRKARIVHQQHAAIGQIAGDERVGLELGMQLKERLHSALSFIQKRV